MYPELNLNYDEKVKILEWKEIVNKNRKFVYAFVENGKFYRRWIQII
jgi:hypothetical protein